MKLSLTNEHFMKFFINQKFSSFVAVNFGSSWFICIHCIPFNRLGCDSVTRCEKMSQERRVSKVGPE